MKSTYKVKRFEPRLQIKRKAIDVLYEKMMFYKDKSDDLYKKVLDLLYERGNAALVSEYTKTMHKYNAMVLDCARALAPYQSPKLESIEIKKNVTHRYVIKAPMPSVDVNTWLAQSDQLLKQLPAPPKFKDIEDTEYIENITEQIPLERNSNFVDINAL